LLVSLSKLPSVTVFALSDAIWSSLFRYARTVFPAGPPALVLQCAHS
jgi:hypothetical protein